MKLSAPTKPLFIISAVLFVLGVLGIFAVMALAPYASWLLIIAWIVLAVGCLMRGA